MLRTISASRRGPLGLLTLATSLALGFTASADSDGSALLPPVPPAGWMLPECPQATGVVAYAAQYDGGALQALEALRGSLQGMSSLRLNVGKVVSCDPVIRSRLPDCLAFTVTMDDDEALRTGFTSTDVARTVSHAERALGRAPGADHIPGFDIQTCSFP